jgi:dihydropteroate synthase
MTTLNIRQNLISIDHPWVMGILNLTPDSFFDKSRIDSTKKLLEIAENMLADGAKILDIGAQSTRPGAQEISAEDEISRILPALKVLRKEFPEAILSIDTFRSEVAQISASEGADIINDISSGDIDPEMIDTMAKIKLPYIVMHMQGIPQNMQKNPVYQDVTKEVIVYLSNKINQLRLKGVHDIIIDPGFGFGKTTEHNYQLMNNLHHFQFFNRPILVGISRKSMINKVLEIKPENALNGTTVLNTLALLKGASILRVHDVKEAVETVRIIEYLNESNK